jgi:hypothetical protein
MSNAADMKSPTSKNEPSPRENPPPSAVLEALRGAGAEVSAAPDTAPDAKLPLPGVDSVSPQAPADQSQPAPVPPASPSNVAQVALLVAVCHGLCLAALENRARKIYGAKEGSEFVASLGLDISEGQRNTIATAGAEVAAKYRVNLATLPELTLLASLWVVFGPMHTAWQGMAEEARARKAKPATTPADGK